MSITAKEHRFLAGFCIKLCTRQTGSNAVQRRDCRENTMCLPMTLFLEYYRKEA